MTALVSALMGVVIGLVLGVFGSGGSILTIPLLVYGLGLEPKSAIASSLVIVAFSALIAACGQFVKKNVILRTALIFGVVGMAGAQVGTRLAFVLTGDQQLMLFGVVMFVAAARMLVQAGLKKEPVCQPDNPVEIHWIVASLSGFFVGLVTGVVGVGGGFMIVPALSFAGVPIHLAMGTSLLVIFLNCLSAIAGYVGQTRFVWPVIIPFAVSSALMSLVGVRLAGLIPVKSMHRAFAVFLLFVAILVLVENFV